MTKDIRTVPPSMPAASAWDLMRAEKIRHLLVKDGSAIVGVLSDRDAGGRNGRLVRSAAVVSDLMTENVLTIGPDETIRKIANLMRGRTIGCLPVVKGNRLLGIVTTADLLELLGRGIDRPSPSVRHELNHRAPHRKSHGAYGTW